MNVRLDSFRSVGGKTDIDTLTLVLLYHEKKNKDYYYHSGLIRCRAVAESCREEPMYRSN
jgi:hypothetical protein